MGNKTFAIRPFEKLKKKIEDKQAPSTPLPFHQKKKEVFTEEELFHNAMDDVQEIEAFRSLTCVPRLRKTDATLVHRNSENEALDVLGEIARGQRPIYLPHTQEYVEWVNPEFHEDVIRNLHEGQFSVQAYLDLHGCTVLEAEEELAQFIQGSFKKNLRCVKVIHGRGLRSVNGARLKDAVVKRLAGHFRKDIIAFVTARQCDGGLGALYILLKKK